MFKNILRVKIFIISLLFSGVLFASAGSVVSIVCHEAKPENVHSRVSRILSKVGIKNEKILGYVDKLFNHQAVKQVSAQIETRCK